MEFLAPREWLAVVPDPPPKAAPAVRVLGAPPPAVPGRELRAAEPLTRRVLLRELRDCTPAWSAAALQISLVRGAGRAVPLLSIAWAPFAALCAVVAWFANATAASPFGRTQMAAGLAAVVCYACMSFFVLIASAARAGLVTRASARLAGGPDEDASSHPFAVVARYLQVVRSKGESEARLLAHDADDDLCPCFLKSCAAGLPRAAGYWRWAEYLVRTSVLIASLFLIVYTCLVTMAPVTWHVWWGIVPNLSVVVYLALCCPYFVAVRFVANPPIRNLQFRLRHRAAAIALRALLQRFRTKDGAEKEDGSSGVPDPTDSADEPLVVLHALFTAIWAARSGQGMTSAPYVVFYLAAAAVCSIINIAAGSCVPAYVPAILVQMLVTFTVDVVSLATSNAEIEGIAALYSAAETELRGLSLRRDDAARAADVLATFARVRDTRARLAGIAVDFGVVRTVLLTSFTVLVGLWTLLRSAGVVVSLDIACRG
ncbi:hypothetical protein DFJ74DRAFT_713916 [Hyaloraphidium curvatum]|nr:hypothetical protein DFJ74DRAFT_713916 [Hyaloraphidium curvatum]